MEELLARAELSKLPALYSQQGKDDPIFYVKLAAQDESWTAYLSEGAPEGDDFVVFGLFVGFAESWTQIPVSKLERCILQAGLRVHREEDFKPSHLSDLVGLRGHK